MKNEFKTDNSNSDLKSFLDRPMTRESWLGKSLLRQISIVSVNGTFVNKFSISNEVMKYEPALENSLSLRANSDELSTVY